MKTQFTVYVPGLNPGNLMSMMPVLKWQGKPITYNGKEVGRVSVVDVKNDGRVIITAEVESDYASKNLGKDLVLRD
ncbi:MAG: hypothetical protein NT004_07915 [Bacteroidetes bacterium]|nr:hypothetical protein [Bacteroidota bacterium]